MSEAKNNNREASDEQVVMQHVAWACKTCNKIDWVDSKEQLAKPEHISHRGIDIGTCDGEMMKLYAQKGA
jgi:hypothetical protein